MGSSMRSTKFVSCIFFLTIVAIHNCLCNGSSNTTCFKIEKQALLKFKQDLKYPSNRLSSWTGENCCQWTGIVCDNLTGHVHEIRLRNPYPDCVNNEAYSMYKLGGEVNHSLLDLKHLHHLDLSGNDFESIQIPSFIGSIGSLRYLNLSHARFSGTIPHQLGNLSMLHYLGLGGVSDNGALRASNLQWLSGLVSLQHLDVLQVDLGKAVDWLQVINTLPSLVELHMSGCQLKNVVSPSIKINFTSLTILDLSSNYFETSIPEWILGLNNLIFLNISSCQFHGPVPSGLQNMTSLRVFDATSNHLNSSLPVELFGLSGLSILRLGYNDFEGPLPIGLLNMTSLRDLHLPRNFFNSTLPSWLYSFNSLEVLNLRGNDLEGVVSSAIGNMTSLTSLHLSYNQLEGRIPQSLGKLCNLKEIDLSRNKFGGQVGEVFKSFPLCMSNRLEWVKLGYNYLSGPIPVLIGRLRSLTMLNLSYNQLNGSLPESLGQLAKLEKLDISYNFLKGVVSDVHFANLKSLYFLRASGNNFTFKASTDSWFHSIQFEHLELNSWQLGPKFPLWLQSQKKLIHLSIANTNISDSIPGWFWLKSSQLQYLNLSSNQLWGKIPRIPEVVASESIIDLSSNCFTGRLPIIPSNVSWLDLSNNSFSGSIYHALCGGVVKSSRALKILNLGNNLLSGRIPNCWKHWQDVKTIKLDNNYLVGSIPQSIGRLNSLVSLHLRHNKLSGEIPQSLQNCTYLLIIDLSANKFNGSIPTWIGNSFSKLVVLGLRSNKFQGHFPYELCHLSSLQILDLAHNNLSGPLPNCLNNFSVMTVKQNPTDQVFFSIHSPNYLENAFLVTKGREVEYRTTLKLVTSIDLSVNNLSGQIPKGLTRLVGLRSLNLSGNCLTGRIPDDIGDMGLLESLDFSLNQLGGEIPLSLGSLTFLSHLNLSYNNLRGKIPSSTQLQSLDNSSFVGNKLCGPPLENCKANREIPKVGHGDSEEGEGFEEEWFFDSLGLGFLVGLGALFGPLLFKMSWRIAYFRLVDGIGNKICNFIFKC